MSPIALVATLKVKPEYTDEVIKFFKTELIDQSRAEANNIQYDLHQGLQDKNTLIMYEIWASQQAIDEHNETAHFKNFVAYIGDKVESVNITLLEKL